jgi:hypothetical protein
VIALLVNPNNPTAERTMRDAQEAARAKEVQLLILKAGTESEIDAAFASFVQLHASALLVGQDSFFVVNTAVPWLKQNYEMRNAREACCRERCRDRNLPILPFLGFLSREIVDRAVLSLKDAGVPSFLIE